MKSSFLIRAGAGAGQIVFALTVLTLLRGAHAAEQTTLLWQIGKPDNDNREFSLAPKGYGEFREDGFFIVGRSDSKRDWPYVHPGPQDAWAGGSQHTERCGYAPVPVRKHLAPSHKPKSLQQTVFYPTVWRVSATVFAVLAVGAISLADGTYALARYLPTLVYAPTSSNPAVTRERSDQCQRPPTKPEA